MTFVAVVCRMKSNQFSNEFSCIALDNITLEMNNIKLNCYLVTKLKIILGSIVVMSGISRKLQVFRKSHLILKHLYISRIYK